MNIVLLGIQGTGKGTLISNLKTRLDFTCVSTGDLLREEVKSGSDLGQYIKKIQDKGSLVDIDIVMKIISQKLKRTKDIVIFDGFPRNVQQADELEKICKVDLVIYLDLKKDIARTRLKNRLTCVKCNFVTSRTQVKSTSCPVCGGELRVRTDDTESGIEKRFATFEHETLPVIEKYASEGVKIEKVDAGLTPQEILEKVMRVIN